MRTDAEYKAFVEESFAWSPIMWEIAKELIGDKVVDIIFRFLPGFSQANNVKDAVKALNSGDWPTFIYEVGQIVVANTPLGQLLRTWGALNEVRDLVKWAGRIWDKIENFSEAAIQRLWDIARKTPLKFNEKYLRYVGDLETPKLGNAVGAPGEDSAWYEIYNFYKGVFSDAFPELVDDLGNMEIHHAIPRRMLMPEFSPVGITPNQMHSLENLRGIAKTTLDPDGSGLKLHQVITNRWQQNFFPQYVNSGTIPSMAEINAFAKQIDDLYGDLFTPPVR